MPRRYLQIASNRLFWKPGDPFIYPFNIDISVDADPPKVALSEGAAHGSVGGVFTPSEALSDKWAQHVHDAGGLWLRPYLQRLADGETVSESELSAHFVRLHGQPPVVITAAQG